MSTRHFAAVLAVPAAAVVVLALVLPSSAAPVQPSGLDHFKCYTIRVSAASTHVPAVTLIDQFGTKSAKVAARPDRLCNPVEKTVPGRAPTSIKNPLAHLVCYPVKTTTSSREVLVTNQFGVANLTVGTAQRLCLPSWKLFTPSFPSAPQPPNLDHFLCYPAKYSTVGTQRFKIPPVVGLKDQFESVSAKVGAPVELCNPVEKILPTGAAFPIKNKIAHLVCFPIRQAPAHVSRHVFTKNQFGMTVIDTVAQSRLCLPSFKREL